MENTNMELFNEFTAQVFAQLYQAFPEYAPLDAGRLSGCKPDDYGAIGRRGEICAATIQWLADSGFIRLGERQGWMFPAVLSAKGLETLKVTPTQLAPGKSAGERIVGAVAEGAMQTASNLVASALTQGFALLLRQ